MLQYQVQNTYTRLCDKAASCPFTGNTSFSFQFNVSDAYQGVSFNTRFILLNGVDTENVLGCILTETSPIVQDYAWYPLVFIIFGIVLLTAATFVLASWLDPFTGTKNIMHWGCNFVNDPNVIRLITPGVFDFFKYLQFAVFLACLSLDYPGIYSPFVSSFSWSCLFFPSSVVANKKSEVSDGLYLATASFGLQRFSEILQMKNSYDIWGSFMVYMFILTGGFVLMFQLCVFGRYLYNKVHRDDGKFNAPETGSFAVGIVVRMFFNLFAFPLLVFTFFQFFVSPRGSPVYLTVLAALLLVAWLAIAAWIGHQLFRTLPRETLFTDNRLAMKFGTFYNTYTEQGSIFFAIDLLTVLLRSIAVGAVQRSGLAQIILLAVIEIFYFFSLIVYKPFDPDTSMNLVSCLTSGLRFVLIFLSLPFLNSLDVDLITRQWLGYVILVIHGLVILLFLMHAVQVVVEVLVRRSSASADDKSSTVFCMKKLSRRKKGTAMVEVKEPLASMDSTNPEVKSYDENTLLSRGPTQKSFGNKSSLGGGYVTSPVSEVSSSIVATPLSAHLLRSDSETFYRKPRRRVNSHDPTTNAVNGTAGKEVDALRSEVVSPPPAGVDYAVREADLYYRKQGQYGPAKRQKSKRQADSNMAGDFAEKVEDPEFAGEHDTVSNLQEDSTGSPVVASPTARRKSLISNWFKNKRPALNSANQDDLLAPRGFEVLSRGPIRPLQEADNASSSSGSVQENEPATTTTTQPQAYPFIIPQVKNKNSRESTGNKPAVPNLKLITSADGTEPTSTHGPFSKSP